MQSPPSHTNYLKPSYTDHPPASPFHYCCDAHTLAVFAPIFALFSSELTIQQLVLLGGHNILCVLSDVIAVHRPWKLAIPSIPTLFQTSNWSWIDHRALERITRCGKCLHDRRHPVVGVCLQLLRMPRASELPHRWMYSNHRALNVQD